MDLVVSRVYKGLDLPDVRLRVRPARQCDLILGDQGRGLLEVPWRRQDLREFAGQLLVGPQPVRGPPAFLGRAGVAHLETALGDPVAAARLTKLAYQRGVRLDADEPVADPASQRGGPRPEPGDQVAGAELLAGEEISDTDHDSRVPG